MSGPDDVDMDRMRALWAQKLTAAAVGAELGISGDRARDIARQKGLPPKRQIISVPRKEMCMMWHAGVSRSEIAARFGVSPPYISQLASRWKLPARGAGGRPRADAVAPGPKDVPGDVPVARSVAAPPIAAKGSACEQPRNPNWPPSLDAAVRATGGRHRAVSDLAAEIGRPIAAVQARWHLIRGRT
ncbi:hypothetical protein OEW28_18700 [Defluviimonas sp. WL0002]|uniref:Uncharacterized protein n=1 Tax=Albidovulum marisflavi TaxID=2984159 RepID=A0ABT2ZHM5_9RHOB|nr:hypothetical protein [Defluviimonas sp. WL0002]MCV2870647.1 hypothetical protein [Defluviimonas sp. WL0002]